MPADNVISLEDRKAERIEKASTVSYTDGWEVRLVEEGVFVEFNRVVSVEEFRKFLRKAGALIGEDRG